MSHFDRFDIVESQYYVLTKYPHLFPLSVHKRFEAFMRRVRFSPGLFILHPHREDSSSMRFNASQILRSVRMNNWKVKNFEG